MHWCRECCYWPVGNTVMPIACPAIIIFIIIVLPPVFLFIYPFWKPCQMFAKRKGIIKEIKASEVDCISERIQREACISQQYYHHQPPRSPPTTVILLVSSYITGVLFSNDTVNMTTDQALKAQHRLDHPNKIQEFNLRSQLLFGHSMFC